MSDPVTNVEIEDVLSSIRRLVSDGDKARTRDPAPVEPESDELESDAEEAAAAAESTDAPRPEKLVLTPAFMIVDNDADVGLSVDEDQSSPVALEADEADSAADDAAAPPEALVLPDPIEIEESEPAEDESEVEAGAEDAPVTEASGRASLVATIAELEAAVSSSDDDYELDGSEETGETIAWPGAMARNFDDVEDAMTEDDTLEELAEAPPETVDVDAPVEDDVIAQAQPESVAEVEVEAEAVDDAAQDVYEDDDLDGLLDAGGVSIDEEALRDLVATVVREELTGPLGERITRNVRKLVRREIYRILSSQEFD